MYGFRAKRQLAQDTRSAWWLRDKSSALVDAEWHIVVLSPNHIAVPGANIAFHLLTPFDPRISRSNDKRRPTSKPDDDTIVIYKLHRQLTPGRGRHAIELEPLELVGIPTICGQPVRGEPLVVTARQVW
jgi:hypothetical protein